MLRSRQRSANDIHCAYCEREARWNKSNRASLERSGKTSRIQIEFFPHEIDSSAKITPRRRISDLILDSTALTHSTRELLVSIQHVVTGVFADNLESRLLMLDGGTFLRSRRIEGQKDAHRACGHPAYPAPSLLNESNE
jgi:hypothetical protein